MSKTLVQERKNDVQLVANLYKFTKTVKATDLKFDVRFSRDSPDMIR